MSVVGGRFKATPWMYRRVLDASVPRQLLVPLLLLLVASRPQSCDGLKMLGVKVPQAALGGHSVQLECLYTLEDDLLYAVKWYHGAHEFYRYVPAEDPPASVFHLNGIEVDLDESNENRLVLRSISSETAGRFRCEVSAEAPSFQTVSGHADMTIVQLPQRGPIIVGGKPRYSVGDAVEVNCTSLRSSPAANLTWFVNDIKADRQYLREYPIIENVDGLETSVLGLHFTVRSRHFHKGNLKLKCMASIAALYWQVDQTSAQPEHPHHQRSSTSTFFLDNHSALASAAVTVHALGPSPLVRPSLLFYAALALIVYVVGTS